MNKNILNEILALAAIAKSESVQAISDKYERRNHKTRNNWDQWQEHKKKECEKRRAKKKANKRRKK